MISENNLVKSRNGVINNIMATFNTETVKLSLKFNGKGERSKVWAQEFLVFIGLHVWHQESFFSEASFPQLEKETILCIP